MKLAGGKGASELRGIFKLLELTALAKRPPIFGKDILYENSRCTFPEGSAPSFGKDLWGGVREITYKTELLHRQKLGFYH